MASTRLCHIDAIAEGSTKGFIANGLKLFAVKRDSNIYLYSNHCPHLGIELNWQEDQFLNHDANLIQCATHGALFLVETGECISGPCLGQQLAPVPFTTVDDYIVI